MGPAWVRLHGTSATIASHIYKVARNAKAMVDHTVLGDLTSCSSTARHSKNTIQLVFILILRCPAETLWPTWLPHGTVMVTVIDVSEGGPTTMRTERGEQHFVIS